jgi:hypothetical protein
MVKYGRRPQPKAASLQFSSGIITHRAHIEALAQGFQGGGDAVDAGGVLDVGEAVDFRRRRRFRDWFQSSTLLPGTSVQGYYMSPLWGLFSSRILPTAYAVGCILSPLRG